MAAPFCGKGACSTDINVAPVDARELVKLTLGIVGMPGDVIAATNPIFDNGRIPGSAMPIETNESAG